jgi:hypothetical protein
MIAAARKDDQTGEIKYDGARESRSDAVNDAQRVLRDKNHRRD